MTAPGWYADPTRRYPLRYWDGTQWTDHVSHGPGSVGTDPLAAALAQPAPVAHAAAPAASFITRRHVVAGALTLVATSIDAGLLRLLFFDGAEARDSDGAGFLVATFATSVALSFLIFLVTAWPQWRPHAAALTGAALLCALVLTGVAPAQADLDQPFASPTYLVHALRGDYSGYFLLGAPPRTDGTFEVGDGTGGTYGYDSDYVSGPLRTPREVCETLADRGGTTIDYGATFSCAGAGTAPSPHRAESTSAGHDAATVILGLFWTAGGAATGLGGAAAGGAAAFAVQRFGWGALRRLLRV